MADAGGSRSDPRARDWASDRRALAGLWGAPAVAMLAALALEPTWRAAVWAAMLTWMGVACLLNARRCGRTHCRVTGPFLLAMAVAVVGYALGLLSLGRHGWILLGVATVVGFAGLWWSSERLWGAYRRMGGKPSSDER